MLSRNIGVYNFGISFGLFSDLIPGLLIFLFLALLYLNLLVSENLNIGWRLFLAGGLANSISRLLWGGVWDYMHWTFALDLWFNVADVLILLGIINLLWTLGLKNGETQS